MRAQELAVAQANLAGARHETTESWERLIVYRQGGQSADALLAKTKACQPPLVKFTANPERLAPESARR